LRRPIYRRLDLVDAKHLKLFRRPLWLPRLPLLESLPQANKLPLLVGSAGSTTSQLPLLWDQPVQQPASSLSCGTSRLPAPFLVGPAGSATSQLPLLWDQPVASSLSCGLPLVGPAGSTTSQLPLFNQLVASFLSCGISQFNNKSALSLLLRSESFRVPYRVGAFDASTYRSRPTDTNTLLSIMYSQPFRAHNLLKQR
jgi:hypothetical protein